MSNESNEYAGELVRNREELNKIKGKVMDEIFAIQMLAEKALEIWRHDKADPKVEIPLADIIYKITFLRGYTK